MCPVKGIKPRWGKLTVKVVGGWVKANKPTSSPNAAKDVTHVYFLEQAVEPDPVHEPALSAATSQGIRDEGMRLGS